MDIRKLKRLIFLLLILSGCLIGVFYKYTCDKDAQRFYRQGSSLYEQKKYSDAYYNFKQIKSFTKLYESALLKQYECAIELSDKRTALLKIREIVKITKNDIVKVWAYYNEAILSQELKATNKEQLIKKFSFINSQYPKTDFGVASAYKLAQLIKQDDLILAKKNFLNYLSYAPNGKYSLSSIEELKKLDVEFSQEDYEILADAQYANAMYSGAIINYEQTEFLKNWHKIAKCYMGLKNFEKEKQIILKGFELNYSTVSEKDISFALDRLLAINGGNKVQTLQKLYTKYPETYIFPTIAYKLAESSSSIRSTKLYEQVVNNYPNSIWAPNSLWEIFWYNYTQNRFKMCEKLAKKYIGQYKNTKDAPRVAYWYGRVLLKSKKMQQAREVFYDIISEYPLNYYAYMSARQLKMSKAKKMILRKPIVSYDLSSLNKIIFHDELILQFALNDEWRLIEDFRINDNYINSWIYHKKEKYPLAINIAKNTLFDDKKQQEEDEDNGQNKKIAFSNQKLKLIYPVYYENIINEKAKKYKQSPYLFMSLIREESHFDKNAKSSVGALGLSQLMQNTANFIEKKKVPKDDLLNPEKNIDLGIKYFAYLSDYFDKDEYLAILAYNAGPGNIKKWLANPNIGSSEIDVFVENIPYLETKNYIKKILSTYWTYLNVYSTKNR